MCLITFAYRVHPVYKLIVVANRDEFFERPTQTAHWWEEYPQMLAGKDLKSKGSWLGVTKTGRFAALTNFREGMTLKPNTPSRGELVTDFLTKSINQNAYLEQVHEKGDAYNGYNLLTFDGINMGYTSNQGIEPTILNSGIYGLSNHLLDTPWIKVQKAKQNLTRLMTLTDFSVEEAFKMMQDDVKVEDVDLPDTNIPKDLERMLSSMFIKSPNYGTRCTTIVLIDYEGYVTFEERSFVPKHRTKIAFSVDVEE